MAKIRFQGKDRELTPTQGKRMFMQITLQEIRAFPLNKLPGSRHPVAMYFTKAVVLQAMNGQAEPVALCHSEADLKELVRTLQNPNQIRLEKLEEAQAERHKLMTRPTMTREALVTAVHADARRRDQYTGSISFEGRRVTLVIDRDDNNKVQPGEEHLCRFARELDSGSGFRVWLVRVTKALPDQAKAITALKAKIKAGQA